LGNRVCVLQGRTVLNAALVFWLLASLAAPVFGAVLPAHGPLRILIVSDEVNPHGLSDAELTQPGDLLAAIANPASGIVIDPAPDGVIEIATDDLALATAALSVPIDDPTAYDVVVYFAHRTPGGGASAQLQSDFEIAVEVFLVAGSSRSITATTERLAKRASRN